MNTSHDAQHRYDTGNSKSINIHIQDASSVISQLKMRTIDKFCIEPIPKKRKKRSWIASILIFAITASIVLVFCFFNRKEFKYQKNESATHNQTLTCYKRTEETMFRSLFSTLLSFLGIILGTLVDRISLIFEERHHVTARYGGSKKKMFKACFTGIWWRSVIIVKIFAALFIIALFLLTEISVEVTTCFAYIVGGISVGPFIINMLNLNTQSEVHVSTILEEKGKNIANALAWHYYFNYLKQALTKFTELTSDNRGLPVELSENKLLLLLSHDCHTEDNLENIDRNIKKVGEIKSDEDESFRFPVYQLTVKEDDYRHYAVQFVKGPLLTLKKMGKYEIIKSITEEQCEDETKLLCREMFEIIRTKLKKPLQDKCVLIPFKVQKLQWLDNGGLVRLMLHAIQHASTQTADTSKKQDDGFWKFLCHEGSTSSANETDVITTPNQLGSVFYRIFI